MEDLAPKGAAADGGVPPWLPTIAGHPCYDPAKDLVVPSFKSTSHYHGSPLLGAEPLARDILLFFRGDVGKERLPHYSRGVRQRLAHLSKTLGWKEKYNVLIGDGREVPGEYTSLLARSVFCLVLPGDGFSARAADAILHGCLPVVIQARFGAVAAA